MISLCTRDYLYHIQDIWSVILPLDKADYMNMKEKVWCNLEDHWHCDKKDDILEITKSYTLQIIIHGTLLFFEVS